MSWPWSLKLNQRANPTPVMAKMVANMTRACCFLPSIRGSFLWECLTFSIASCFPSPKCNCGWTTRAWSFGTGFEGPPKTLPAENGEFAYRFYYSDAFSIDYITSFAGGSWSGSSWSSNTIVGTNPKPPDLYPLYPPNGCLVISMNSIICWAIIYAIKSPIMSGPPPIPGMPTMPAPPPELEISIDFQPSPECTSFLKWLPSLSVYSSA